MVLTFLVWTTWCNTQLGSGYWTWAAKEVNMQFHSAYSVRVTDRRLVIESYTVASEREQSSSYHIWNPTQCQRRWCNTWKWHFSIESPKPHGRPLPYTHTHTYTHSYIYMRSHSYIRSFPKYLPRSMNDFAKCLYFLICFPIRPFLSYRNVQSVLEVFQSSVMTQHKLLFQPVKVPAINLSLSGESVYSTSTSSNTRTCGGTWRETVENNKGVFFLHILGRKV